jgi:hypothetical protein
MFYCMSKLECSNITYMEAFIGLQHVSIDIFNGIFSNTTSSIFVVHLQFSSVALTFLLHVFFDIYMSLAELYFV